MSLKRQKILLRKEHVRKEILELNAEGVQQQKKKKVGQVESYRNPGPKYVWHIDGHGKLKPFVFKFTDVSMGYQDN